MINYRTIEGIEFIYFDTEENFEEHKSDIVFLKIIGERFVDDMECYVFKLENGEEIAIDMWEIYKIQVHESNVGNIYKPIVIINDDNIEHVGFQALE